MDEHRLTRRAETINSLKKYSSLLVVLLALVAMFTLANPLFISIDNILAVLRQISIYGVMGIGMAALIINGFLDLSVGAMAGMTGMVAVYIMRAGGNMWQAILGALAVGIGLGLFNGSIIAITKIPAFILTLAMTQVFRGTIYLITGGAPLSGLTEGYLAIGRGSLMGIPIPIYVLAVMLLLGWFILNRTSIGRAIYACGGNAEAAKYSGLKVNRVTLFSFGYCGAMAAVGGVLLSSRLQSAQPSMGTSYEMEAIAVAAIGGTSLTGGEGTIAGVFLGSVIMGVINNGMVMMGINSYWQMVVKGTVIALAVIVDMMRKNHSSRKA